MTIHQKLDYIMANGGSGGGGTTDKMHYIQYLGTGTSFNVKELVPDIDYTQLTVDNFITEIKSMSASISAKACTGSTSGSGGITLGKTYNAQTGILTITNVTCTAHSLSWDGSKFATCNTTANCAAWLYKK